MKTPTSRNWDALALDEADDVAVALSDLARDSVVRIWVNGAVVDVVATDDIALGHKISLETISVGAPIRKHGQPIGYATKAINRGSHVHVHNVRSARAGSPKEPMESSRDASQ